MSLLSSFTRPHPDFPRYHLTCAMPRDNRSMRVHEEIERLGLRVYNNNNSVSTNTRPVFKNADVLRLYRLEIPALFGILLRDEGSVLSREDPNLFDKELDKVLEEFGPLVWPVSGGEGSRDHLRVPQENTLYTKELIYPQDTAQYVLTAIAIRKLTLYRLKDGLRNLILAKKARPDIDVQALIEKRHKDAHMKLFGKSVANTPAPVPNHMNADSASESEDSVMGTTTKRGCIQGSASSQTGYSSVQLRLYRSVDDSLASVTGPTFSCGPMMLTADCTKSHDCFRRICEHIATDCSFMIFELPEDMSFRGRIRVDRGSQAGETAFQEVLAIFRKAKKFPGEPQYRSVEVEVGLDVPCLD